MITVDLLDDHPIPHFSNLLQCVPVWNKHNVCIVEAIIIEFDNAYLHDDVVVLLFILENTTIRNKIKMHGLI